MKTALSEAGCRRAAAGEQSSWCRCLPTRFVAGP